MKECPECNEQIRGRADKKFCSDLCRNAYNNKINSTTSNFVRNVNSILRRNRRIIQELVPEDSAKTTKDTLTRKGFNFQYITNTYTTKKGLNYFFCYEYGYLPIENEHYFLVKKKE